MAPRATTKVPAGTKKAKAAKAPPAPALIPESVVIYGYVSQDKSGTYFLYQGLGISQHYLIPKSNNTYVLQGTCPVNPSLLGLLLPATLRITYVSGSRKATLPASSLAAVVGHHLHKSGPVKPCPAGCYCNGICVCSDVDYWFNLDGMTAQRLGVIIED
jgi:hypothetical protein